jgi:hypothetical protein
MTNVREKTDWREVNIANRMGRCVHFTGLMGAGMEVHPACAAGVRYDIVTIKHEPMPYERRGVNYTTSSSMPCLSGSHNLAGATCDKRHTMTREEAEADERKMSEFIEQMGTARKAILANIKATGKNGGSIPCPSCKSGTLGYSRASSNGHVHAHCSTAGCLSWME